MQIPKGMTEQEVLNIFEEVINKIAQKFVFSYVDLDDVKQEARAIAIQGLKNYDNERPLANFLYIHIKNRLCNFKRKLYIRREKPCSRCPLKAFLPPEGCKLYTNLMDCKFYLRWHDRNIIKRNLSHPLEYNQVADHSKEKNMRYQSSVISGLATNEILIIIDNELPAIFRKHYTMLINGIKISKKDEDNLKNIITQILHKYNLIND